MSNFTHLDGNGRAQMVDVSAKGTSIREAVAAGSVYLNAETFSKLLAGTLKKGDALVVARIAGIQAAKRTHEIIPLCHPLCLTYIDVQYEAMEYEKRVQITATVRNKGETGVEMEALMAVSAAALTIYDMCKAVQKDIRIGDIHLLKKSGGKGGTYICAK